jgi:hypothetical protein
VQLTVVAGSSRASASVAAAELVGGAARQRRCHLAPDHGERREVDAPRAATAETVRTLYVFEGSGVEVDGDAVGASTGAVVRSDTSLELVGIDDVEVLVLQGRPIGEPVAQYGPFVMNNRPRSSRRSPTTAAPGSAGGRGPRRSRSTPPRPAGSPAARTAPSRCPPRHRADAVGPLSCVSGRPPSDDRGQGAGVPVIRARARWSLSACTSRTRSART